MDVDWARSPQCLQAIPGASRPWSYPGSALLWAVHTPHALDCVVSQFPLHSWQQIESTQCYNTGWKMKSDEK